MTGQKFGRLTVIAYAETNKNRKTKWLCKCECGSKIIIIGSNLKNGHTQSCGCLQKETISKIKKKYNEYNLRGVCGVGYTSNKNEEFYFDLEDYDKIKKYCWSKDSSGYIYSRDNDINKIIYMHRLVTNCSEDMDVDHIYHNKCDNRKKFLRIVTTSQNLMNSTISINNTSGVTGVSWNKRDSNWESHIGLNNKKINLGYFNNFDDAVKARQEAELKYFGEFRYKNNHA